MLITTDDGVQLNVTERGSGEPLLFIHEFAGDSRSWEPQTRHFEGGYRTVAYDARGYPPSDVPSDLAAYSQERAVADAIAVLDALDIPRAHVVGLSMGGFCALHLAVRHPDRLRSVVVGGTGYGAHPDQQESFRAECEAIARAFEDEGSERVAERYAVGPSRVQLQNKNPEGWQRFARELAEHSAEGARLTMLGVQRRRPSIYAMRDELAKVTVPCLIMAGDEDEGSIDASIMLKRTMPTAGLAVLPKTGHTLNLEEPARFNAVVEHFLDAVAKDAWKPRDPRSLSTSVTGMDEPAPATAPR